MSSRLTGRQRRLFAANRDGIKNQKVVSSAAKIIRLLERPFRDSAECLKRDEEIVNYLNELCTAIAHVRKVPDEDEFYVTLCKRIARYVFSDSSSIRAVTYRILRKASQSVDDLSVLLCMHMDILAVRSLELNINNTDERTEALKLCVLMLNRYNEKMKIADDCLSGKNDFSGTLFPNNIYRTEFAIACTLLPALPGKPKVEEDELALSCLAVIAEQAAIAPDLILNCIGIGWITELLTYAILSERLSASICRILCTWLDSPLLRTRAKLHLVLEQIFAPVIEIGLFQRKEITELKQQRLPVDMLQLESFSQTFLNLMRTWPGLFACSASDEQQKTPIRSPLRFLDFVGLSRVSNINGSRVRDLIIECCCEILELPYSKMRFVDWLHTVQFYSTIHHPDAYKCSVRDEFVLAEHEMLMKTDEQQTNICDLLVSFRAVIVYTLINANLTEALSRLILQDPDDPLALRATLLLNDILIAGSTFLPRDWRLRVLSVPTLVHSACETVTETFTSKKLPFDSGDNADNAIFTYPNARSAFILLHRLGVLNEISLGQKTQPLPITNLQLFVQSSPATAGSQRSKLSKKNRDVGGEDVDFEAMLSGFLIKATDFDGNLCWAVVDVILQLLEYNYSCTGVPIKQAEKCYSIFKQVFTFITPSEGSLITKFDGDRFVIACCCRAIHVSLIFASNEGQYRELLQNFLADFAMNMSPDVLLSGPLSPKNLLNTGAIYYFAFVGAVSASEEGRQMLEATPLLQMFMDLVSSTTNVEYVKLIVSCLDYSTEDSLSRVVFKTALTCGSEAGRKWATRFLGILASHNVNNFVDWGMKLLLGQLTDHSPKVVRHAFRLLQRWIPHYPESIHLIKNIRLDTFGDAGTLLKAHLFGDEGYVKNNFDDFVVALNYWKKKFNMRYVEIIDEDVKVALLGVKRSLDGQYARPSNERSVKFGVPVAVHIYGQLARHEVGRDLLLKSGEIERLLDVLRDSPLPIDAYKIREMRSALFALGHIAAITQNLLPVETVPIICRFAECYPVLSIRGTAFWVLNLIGTTEHGAAQLSLLGWESSNFAISKTKLNLVALKSACKDAKTLIRSIDKKDSSRHGTDVWVEEAASIDYKDSGFVNDKRPLIESTVDELVSRTRRAFTVDSSATSGLGSSAKDELDCGQFWTGEMNGPFGLRRCSESAVFGPGSRLLSRESISAVEIKGEELQNCLTVRSLFRLRSFVFDKVLTVDRTLGGPVNYQYMSEDEFTCYRSFRRLLSGSGSAKDSRNWDSATTTVAPVLSSGQSITLPCHPDLFCKDIFVDEGFVGHDCKFQSVGRKHRVDNCLYCSWPKEFFGSKDSPKTVVSDELRDEIISLFEQQGSKHSMSPKNLFKKYRVRREVFSSLCLYSDIMALLAEYDYSLETRHLAQELFTDALQKF